jgi:pyruvate formate lyase activating enzyme
VRYAYTGNVHDAEGGSTYCHGCGEVLIGRDWFALGEWSLTPDGRCRRCGTACAGVFDARPGTWGARRLPVRLGRGAA